MHYQYILIGASIAMATVLGTFVLSYPPQVEPATRNAELAEPYVYVPSDITKANPNIRVADGHASWRTTNISDVADDVKYTIQGTILGIRDPIDWYAYDSALAGHGSIPVIMSVEEVYKGSFASNTIVFFLGSMMVYTEMDSLQAAVTDVSVNVHSDTCSAYCGPTITIADAVGSPKEYYIYPFEPQFEVGDRVLVHVYDAGVDFFDNKIISQQDLDVLTPFYSVQLGKYGAYHVHEDRIYNEAVPDGASISHAINESQVLE